MQEARANGTVRYRDEKLLVDEDLIADLRVVPVAQGGLLSGDEHNPLSHTLGRPWKACPLLVK